MIDIKLNEATRNQLIAKSKSSEKGKQRFDRRSKSKVQNTTSAMNKIDMNKLFTEDILTVGVPVKGETDDYTVTISVSGIIELLRDEVKRSGRVSFREIARATINAFNKEDVYVSCSCEDFCLEENTRIKLLNGKVVTVKDLLTLYEQGEELWVYSVDEKGDFKPGKVSDVWVSGYVDTLVEVTLDNNKKILTTSNHKYMLRDGTYKRADELESGNSLMPLYFRYNNGYESCKLNSSVRPTIYLSVYKTVANTLLRDEIEKAKARTSEDVIQIHHRDFNKLNNYPSNLFPMGKQEHWKYHYTHVMESGRFKQWQDAGKEYWSKQSSRDKQAAVMHNVMTEYYSKLSTEEISLSRRKSGAYSQEWKNKMSEVQKNVWKKYSPDEYQHRCEINYESNNNPETKRQQSEKRKLYYIKHPEAKDISRENLKKAAEKVRGVPFTEEHKHRIQQSHLNRTPEQKAETLEKRINTWNNKSEEEKNAVVIRNRDSKVLRVLNYMLSNNIELTFDNYKGCLRLPQFYKKSFPFIGKYFETMRDALLYYGIMDNYNHKVKSVNIVKLEKKIPVYDLSVDKYNNFYVDAGVILHNCYRFGFFASKNDFNSGAPETRPSNITNPNDSLGSACKHVLLVLNNNSWIQRIARVISNYVHYMETHYPKMYADIIYPAIYGEEYQEPAQTSMFDDDTLDSDSDTLSAANRWRQQSTRFQKGNDSGIRFAKSNSELDNQLPIEENPDDIL